MKVDEHEISLLADGEQVFPAMLADITRASSEVLLEMYWVGDDPVGVAFRHSLAIAARRGCAVRVIIDGFGSWGLPMGFWDELIAAGGAVRTFHAISDPSQPFFRSLLRRDHRKVLLMDRQVAYVGGLNLASAWQMQSPIGGSFRDVALRLSGAAAAATLAAVFDQTWRYLSAPATSSLSEEHLLPLGPRLMLLVNTPQQHSGRVIRRMYLWAIRQARRTIDITAAYFMPRSLFVDALLRAHRRGVRVRILLPWNSDVLLATLIGTPLVHRLVSRGVMVYSYRARPLHAKTAVVDEKWITVGSHNLDTFSWAWNLECNVAVDDAELGKQMTRAFERDLENSVPYLAPKEGLGGAIKEVASRILLSGYRRI